jgi:ribonuclease P protein component
MPPVAGNLLKNTLGRCDKLKSALEIDELYRENKVVTCFPVKCYYSFSETVDKKSNLRVAFAAPKRSFKHAIDRNTIKRRMREAYRLHYKKIFETFIIQEDKQLKLFFIYVGKEILDFVNIEKNVQTVLQEIQALSVKK